MKRLIFTIHNDIDDTNTISTNNELKGFDQFELIKTSHSDNAKKALLKKYFNDLIDNKREYADKIGVDFKLFHNEIKDFDVDTSLEFTKVNLYKHHLYAKMAEEYDEVLYVDTDVLFNTDENIFDVHDLSKGIHVKDQDNKIISREKSEVLLSFVGLRSPILKYFITKDLLDGKECHVINTGIMLARSEDILKIKFIERMKEAIQEINVLKTKKNLINALYYPNNESIFSYILEKYDVPYAILEDEWHNIYDGFKAGPIKGKCVHIIHKQFDHFFNKRTKAIFSLHIDIHEDNLDHPKSYSDTEENKSAITKRLLNQYKDKLLDNHNDYAEKIGVDYIHYSIDNDYEEFKSRFPDLSEYDVVNLYKVWLLDKLTKDYDTVMYVDFDTVFINYHSPFNTVPADFAFCCIMDDKKLLEIDETNDYLNNYKKDFRNPEAKYWNAHALLQEDDKEGDNIVFNTGVMLASKEVMKQIDYFSDIDSVIETMKELKEDEFSMYPQNIRASFGYDNETIMSYKTKINDVPLFYLGYKWHTRHFYGNKHEFIEGTPERKRALLKLKNYIKEEDTTIIHFISKNFGLVFDK